jgi:hypothetical protein
VALESEKKSSNLRREKEKHKNTEVTRKQLVELSFEDDLCGASDDISDDKSYRNFNELACHSQEEKPDAFLELDFPFHKGNWILVASAMKKINITQVSLYL